MRVLCCAIGVGLLFSMTSYCGSDAWDEFEGLMVKRDIYAPPEEVTPEYEDAALKTKPIIIPLGSNCFQGFFLRDLKLRFLAYPFDWNITSLSAIYQLIENDFDGFCEKNLFFRLSRASVYHKRYQVFFVHDFGGVKNLEDYDDAAYGEDLERATKRYKKRVERFYKAINSGRPICFIRATSIVGYRFFPTNMRITKDWAESFVALLKRKFPKLVFTLVCSDYSEEIKSDWGIPNCVNFYYDLSTWPPDFPRAEVDWRKKLIELGFGG